MADEDKCYRCPAPTCGYVYDPGRGDKKRKIEKGTCFDDLPDDWSCPVCGARRENFCEVEE